MTGFVEIIVWLNRFRTNYFIIWILWGILRHTIFQNQGCPSQDGNMHYNSGSVSSESWRAFCLYEFHVLPWWLNVVRQAVIFLFNSTVFSLSFYTRNEICVYMNMIYRMAWKTLPMLCKPGCAPSFVQQPERWFKWHRFITLGTIWWITLHQFHTPKHKCGSIYIPMNNCPWKKACDMVLRNIKDKIFMSIQLKLLLTGYLSVRTEDLL